LIVVFYDLTTFEHRRTGACYTKEFLTDNAKKFCELASNAEDNIAILTDLDMSDLLIGSTYLEQE
jgi:hypothetical protein